MTNRPAYQPVREGQRLRITATRCRSIYPIVNRITFTGPTVTPEPYRGQRSETALAPVPWVAIGLVCLAIVGLTVRRLSRG
jgi:hypothetical protein